MRLNYHKWRAELDFAMQEKNATHITYLHAVRAHIKGKIHCNSMRLPWSNLWKWGKLSYEDASAVAVNGGSLVVKTNRQDQQLLIGDAWKDYVATSEEQSRRSAKVRKVRRLSTLQRMKTYLIALFSEM